MRVKDGRDAEMGAERVQRRSLASCSGITVSTTLSIMSCMVVISGIFRCCAPVGLRRQWTVARHDLRGSRAARMA